MPLKSSRRLARSARVVVCVSAATLVVSAPAVPAAAKPPAHKCGSMTLGTAYFIKIRATGVPCKRAKDLLDKATLRKNRGTNVFWNYGGWAWSVQGLDEMSVKVRGKRGARRISATMSAT